MSIRLQMSTDLSYTTLTHLQWCVILYDGHMERHLIFAGHLNQWLMSILLSSQREPMFIFCVIHFPNVCGSIFPLILHPFCLWYSTYALRYFIYFCNFNQFVVSLCANQQVPFQTISLTTASPVSLVVPLIVEWAEQILAKFPFSPSRAWAAQRLLLTRKTLWTSHLSTTIFVKSSDYRLGGPLIARLTSRGIQQRLLCMGCRSYALHDLLILPSTT